MKEVLVTGGAGFIGSHLIEELIKNKDYNITVIDPFFGKEKMKLFLDKIVFLKMKIQNIDIKIWGKKRFDVIYHLGMRIKTNQELDNINNAIATEAVTKLLKPDGHFYFASSSAIYGDQKVVTEKSPLQPITSYGYSKWMDELIIKNNCKNYTIFRFSNVFGERNKRGLISAIKYHLKNNEIMIVFNNGENSRDYIYVKDVIKAMTTINKKGIFQIGQNKTYNTLDLVNLSGVEWGYGACGKEVISTKVDNTKLKKEGWKPTLSVTEYIRRIKQWRK